jgi:hypothetical protein
LGYGVDMELGFEGGSKGRSSWLTAACVLFLLTVFPVYPQNLVQNGDFASGGGSFDDWNVSNTAGNPNTYTPAIESGGQNDPYYARFLWEQNGGQDLLSQDISTIPGDVYEISFWAEDGEGRNNVSFGFGNSTENLGDAFAIGPGQWYQGWTNFTFSLTASSLDTELSFLVGCDSASEFGVDGISVVQVPDPDFDGEVVNGKFLVNVETPDHPIVIQASTNMVNWVDVYTNTPPCTFTDACVNPRCFYRARLAQ